jgi:hypothetical protein
VVIKIILFTIRIVKSSRMTWTWNVERMSETRIAYRVSVGKSEGKRPLGRFRRRWKDNIKVDLREIFDYI